MSQKFVIISHGRTGSTALCHALNENSDIVCGYELFGASHQASPAPEVVAYQAGDGYCFLDSFYGKFPGKIQGFKMFTFHGWRTKEERTSWRYLRDATSMKCIFLERRNLLDAYFSEKFAAFTGNWAERRDYVQNASSSIWVDPLQARTYVYETYAEMSWARKFFSHHDGISLFYEDLQADFGGAVSRVTDFLGATRHLPSVVFDGSLGVRARDIVENHEEVIECLKGTVFGTITT